MHLSDIATIKSGYPFRGAIKDAPEGSIAVVQGKDVNPNSGIAWHGLTKTILSGKKSPDWLQEHDIVVAARGVKNYAAYVNAPPTRAVCSPQFFVVRIGNPQALPEFIAWQLNQDSCQQYFDLNRTGHTVGNIKLQALASIPVVLPDLETQNHIISLQRTVNREKTILHQSIDNLDLHMRAIAKDVLHGKLNRGHA